MSMTRTLAELTKDCGKRGIPLVVGKKYGRRDLVNLLAAQSISLRGGMAAQSWGLQRRMEMESPMLCFTYKHLKPQEQENVTKSKRWIVEKKYDGCRMLAFYHPSEGFTLFGRNISVDDYLPVEYTDKMLYIKDGKVMKGSDFKGVFDKAFAIDCEILCDNKNINTALFSQKGVTTGTELNAVSAMLAMNTPDSHQMQMTQAPLRLETFDLLIMDGQWVTKLILEKRKHYLGHVQGVIASKLPITLSPYQIEDKEQFYLDIVNKGVEGVIYKNLDMPYITTESRPRTTQIKRKRSVAESFGGDIDAFVSGFVEADETKAWAHCIGALKLSVFLTTAAGEEEHWLASISSMPLAMREQMSTKDVNGKPTLKEEYYGKVLTINGQDLSPKAKRFMHATCDWDRGFRTDKSKLECLMDESFLDSQIL